MGKEILILSEHMKSIESDHDESGWEKIYVIRGIEVLDGNYKDATMFETIAYKEGGWSSVSPRAWYEEVDEAIKDHLENSDFYNNNFIGND